MPAIKAERIISHFYRGCFVSWVKHRDMGSQRVAQVIKLEAFRTKLQDTAYSYGAEKE